MITLLSSNSRILVTVNENGQLHQLFYPYTGLFQHLHDSRLGVYDVDSGAFDWIDQGEAPVEQGYLDGSNASRTLHRRMDLEVSVDNIVHPNLDVIIRRIRVRNPGESERRLRVFHYQSLTIRESLYQDTAYWDDKRKTINHYKRSYYFQFWGRPDFDAFTCGEHTLKGLKGSYVDAEDGQLSGGRISHGAADSVVQWNIDVPPREERTVHLVVMVARSRTAVNKLFDNVAARPIEILTREATSFWSHWIDHKQPLVAPDLSRQVRDICRRSIFVLRDCASDNGAIVASPDTRTLKSGGDSYSYCWWRDGGYISQAMDDVGLYQNARRFLRFAHQAQEDEGYFLHRHFLDGSVGSTWHPPPFIQIDQTGTVLSSVWRHFQAQGDLDELLENWTLVRRGADFLMSFVDEKGLPKPSYDLWEERFGTHAYSVAAVVHGLESAVRIGRELGKRTAFWEAAAARMRSAALEELWDPDRRAFRKSINPLDTTLDASTLLTIVLDLLPAQDPRAAQLVESIEKRLWNKEFGGIARYEGDQYYGAENPWIICTLWLAEAHLLLGNKERCRELIEWAARQAGPTHLLAEQIDARTGQTASVLPLVWSHATLLHVVHQYSRAVAQDAGAQPKVVRTTAPAMLP